MTEDRPRVPSDRHTVVYKQVDDLAIEADVWLPPDEGPHPVIVFIHGGALIMGSRRWLDPVQREGYVDDGFAVVSIDYRLAPETKLPEIAADLDDAFAWVRRDGRPALGLDPLRVAAVGHSAGGYLALLAGVRARPRLRAIVSFYGYGDITGPWYSRPDAFYLEQPLVTEANARAGLRDGPVASVEGPENEARHRFYLFCRQQGVWPQEVGGADPGQDLPDALATFCPVRQVTPDYPPTLLVHGDRDTDVPYEQSVLMASALRAASVPHELITISNGEHGFDSDMDRPEVAEAFGRVRTFLKQHTT